ncbi:39S ribosomal protein L44, mitochondrial [Intoshia linei]|uniref:39S ribosomal protein L44, mitochondrial n=1 Tax=Intoshia linei TaxID=1819745 RepID=A0A177AUV6_9BILA|nr:39S ribosomal protein L44, mitochondrial [Intoshia linei]
MVSIFLNSSKIFNLNYKPNILVKRDRHYWLPKYLKSLYNRKLEEIDPEKVTPPNKCRNWNYNVEIFAFKNRVKQNFDVDILEKALNIGSSENSYSIQGKRILHQIVETFLEKYYTKLPQNLRLKLLDHFTSIQIGAKATDYIGLEDLIISDEYPASDNAKYIAFNASISALHQSFTNSQIPENCSNFIQNFLITQLNGLYVSNCINIANPQIYIKNILPNIEFRLIF